MLANIIDLDFLSHIILLPEDRKTSINSFFKYADLQAIGKHKDLYKKKLQGMKIEMIIGFHTNSDCCEISRFNESDIAFKTDMLSALELIHAC